MGTKWKFGDWAMHREKGEAVVIGIDTGRILVAFKRNSQSPLLESFPIESEGEWLVPIERPGDDGEVWERASPTVNTSVQARDAQAEILRLRTTETAAAHALDGIRQFLGLDLVEGEHPSQTRVRVEAAITSRTMAPTIIGKFDSSLEEMKAYFIKAGWMEATDD